MKTTTALWATICFTMINLISGAAEASPVQNIDLGSYMFGVGSVYEEPGNPMVRLYGGSQRFATIAGIEFVVLSSNNGFSTAPSWDAISGIVGYVPGEGTSFMPCPYGKDCQGYKAFYTFGDLAYGKLYRCTGMPDYKSVSGCTQWTEHGLQYVDGTGIGFDQTYTKLLVSGTKVSDMESASQVYMIDIATSVATKLTACSDPSIPIGTLGGVAGNYLYVNYNGNYYRHGWNGSTCTGVRQILNTARGWDDAINTAGTDVMGAIGLLSGTFYASRDNGTAVFSQKTAACGDTFTSGSEVCDFAAIWPLNGQTCNTVPGGFTGGTLSCSASCIWNTAACTSAQTCGNNIKEGSEQCDGSDFGGATCASVMGAGYTGSLSCNACSIVTAACVAPPFCGDTQCNGSETCSTCPGDCGSCCGNGTINAGEQCDGANLGGATCASVMGAGYTGSLSCNACAFNTGACVPPVTCGNGTLDNGEDCDGANLGGATCASVMGAGYTGSLSCNACAFVTSACVAPPTCGDTQCNGSETCATCPGDCGSCCGNGNIDNGEQCDGSNLNNTTCASLLGAGYTGDLSCNSCSFVTSACVPPVTCGNGSLDNGEQCDGADLNGKTCESEKGTGWSGALSCNNCAINSAACIFDWGIRNPSGACSKSGTGANQTVNFSGGDCTAEYWPIGALNPVNLKWAATAGKALAIGVMASGQPTVVNVPQGVSHSSVQDNGNKWELTWSDGVSLAVEGTDYSAEEQNWPEVVFTCTDGQIALSFSGNAVDFTVSPSNQGKLPAGWGVGINVQTGEVTRAPYELGGGGTGGSAGAGGSGGEAGTGGTAGNGGEAGTGGSSTGGSSTGGKGGSGGNTAGAAGSTPVTPTADSGDDGGCSTCSTGSRHGANNALWMAALIGLGLMIRRRK